MSDASGESRPISRRLMIGSVAALAAGVLAACKGRGGAAPVAAPPSSPASKPSPRTTASAIATASVTAIARPVHRGPAGRDILSGPTAKPYVALTFHGAGDPSLARQVLREFAAANAHGTILAVGNWLDANPSLVPRILDGGHDLGNHTWSHQVMPRLSAAEADAEVARCAALLKRRTGHHGSWFRPSGTPRSTPTIRSAAGRSGYSRCLSYDVDPLDYTDPGAKAVRDRVLAAARPGSIVSLHLGHAGTVRALPQILDGLASRGLTPVTATTLLGARLAS